MSYYIHDFHLDLTINHKTPILSQPSLERLIILRLEGATTSLLLHVNSLLPTQTKGCNLEALNIKKKVKYKDYAYPHPCISVINL